MKYKLLIDTGKPYEMVIENKELLFNELLELEINADKENYAYCDIIVLNNKGEDITDTIFKEYNFKKEKIGFLK